jgi:hypothetical protein
MGPRAHILESQLRALFCDSLREFESGNEAVDWLISLGATRLIEELATENDKALKELEKDSKPKVAILNRPELVHFAAILGASQASMQQLLRAVDSQLVVKFFPLSGIWKSYATALVNLHRGSRAEVAMPKAKGYEKFFLPYIRYMGATNPQEVEDAKIAIAESFETRNRDRRLRDWIGLDGDGEKPVHWDFRFYAIEAGLISRCI